MVSHFVGVSLQPSVVVVPTVLARGVHGRSIVQQLTLENHQLRDALAHPAATVVALSDRRSLDLKPGDLA